MSDFIDHVIKKHTSTSIQLQKTTSLAGGCINSAYQITTNKGVFFLKCNEAKLSVMFETEAKGLQLLHEKSPLITPKPLGFGVESGKAYLLTDWLEKGKPTPVFWKNFGERLALQHRQTTDRFGLNHDNYIGSLPQSNSEHDNWCDFFIHERLKPQLIQAESHSLVTTTIISQFEKLYSKLDQLIPKEAPALIHGDLWSGNFLIHQSGEAAIFDPAIHYGHRETELAFTILFGGFSPEFYTHYHDAFPLEPYFDERLDIHNLYPLLVHLNLFGSSYLSGIIQTLKRYV